MTQIPVAEPTKVPEPVSATPAAIVEPFSTPELFPGFQELAASEEQRERQVEFQIQQLSQEDKGLINRQAEAQRLLGEQVGLGSEFGIIGQAFRPDTKGVKERRQAIALELDRLIIDRQRAVWRVGVIDVLQKDIREGQRSFTTVDELVGFTTIELSREDRQFAQSIIDNFNDPDITQVAEGDRELFQKLQKPGGRSSNLMSLDVGGMTAAELVDVVIAASRFQLPEGMTIEDQRDALRAHGASDAEIAEITAGNKSDMDLIIHTIREDTARMDTFREELAQLLVFVS